MFLLCLPREAKGDQAGRRRYLDKALAEDSSDIDVLIACYRLPDAPPEYHQKIRKLIEKAAADLPREDRRRARQCRELQPARLARGQYGRQPGRGPRGLKKSVELSPDAGGYYDTLGRVYFAKGDYPNAVKYQSKAAEMEPHSGQIAAAAGPVPQEAGREEEKP